MNTSSGKGPPVHCLWESSLEQTVCNAAMGDHESKMVELSSCFFFNLKNLPLEVYPKEVNMDMHIAVKIFLRTLKINNSEHFKMIYVFR